MYQVYEQKEHLLLVQVELLLQTFILAFKLRSLSYQQYYGKVTYPS